MLCSVAPSPPHCLHSWEVRGIGIGGHGASPLSLFLALSVVCTWASAKETQKSYGRFGGEHNQQLVRSPQKHLNDPLAALAAVAVATVPKMGLKYSHEVN